MTQNKLQQDFLDVIGEMGNISFGTASTTLNALLGEEITISAPKVKTTTKEELMKEFPEPLVLVEVKYLEGLKGHNILLLDPKDAAIIADLMMGGSGEVSNVKLGELELSAVEEAMNQMMGSASTSMSTFLDKDINIQSPNLVFTELGQNKLLGEIFSEHQLIKVDFDMKIGNITQSKLMQVIDAPFAKELASELLGF